MNLLWFLFFILFDLFHFNKASVIQSSNSFQVIIIKVIISLLALAYFLTWYALRIFWKIGSFIIFIIYIIYICFIEKFNINKTSILILLSLFLGIFYLILLRWNLNSYLLVGFRKLGRWKTKWNSTNISLVYNSFLI